MCPWHRVSRDVPEKGLLEGDRVLELGHSSRLIRQLNPGGLLAIQEALEVEEKPPEPAAAFPWAQRVEFVRSDLPYQYRFISQTLRSIAPGSRPAGLVECDPDVRVDYLLPAGRKLVEALVSYAEESARSISALLANTPFDEDGGDREETLREELHRMISIAGLLQEILRLEDNPTGPTEDPGFIDYQDAITRLLRDVEPAKGGSL